MNVLFACMVSMESLEGSGIYSDLLRELSARGHSVYAVVPRERRSGLPTELGDSCGVHLLKVAVGNVTKSGLLEKGLATLSIGGRYWGAFRRYLGGVHFDVVLYTTPPTTLCGFVARVKEATGAATYLLLKDIFPQNSLDLGMLADYGLKAPIYRYFKRTERRTYELADYIGCMSEANRRYLAAHEPWYPRGRIEVNPNSLSIRAEKGVDVASARAGFSLPLDEMVFVYGGSLGKPQDIGFLIDCLRLNEERPVGFFAIAGSGTERARLEAYFANESPRHARLFPMLPREEFDELVASSDAGLLFLDHRFTIPNFPSRLLSYLAGAKPVVAAVDCATDVGEIAEENGFGLQCVSDDPSRFLDLCGSLTPERAMEMGRLGREFLVKNYDVKVSCDLIERHFIE